MTFPRVPACRRRRVQTLSAVHSVGGELSPLPFQSLRNASEAQLKCFQGGLGQATDTYNVSASCKRGGRQELLL